MLVKDRMLLARLMAIQGVSQRGLADAAGWHSHSYVGRLVRGEASRLSPDPAARIAAALEAQVADLFAE